MYPVGAMLTRILLLLVTSFAVRDAAAEYERLESLGVRFTQPPVDYGTAITAVFDDTCGNLIQITQENLGS
jgi:predicted enzyme related to lactoylglutathione lyase